MVGKRIRTSPILLDFQGVPGFVLIITYGHTFATMSLENGMDVKTLSTIIGHVSSATTLNIYTHVTGEMQRNAARNIDQGIAGVEVQEQGEADEKKLLRLWSSPPTALPTAGRGRAASAKSMTTCGRAATRPSGSTAKNTPATSTPIPVRSARRSWRR